VKVTDVMSSEQLNIAATGIQSVRPIFFVQFYFHNSPIAYSVIRLLQYSFTNFTVHSAFVNLSHIGLGQS